MNSKKTTINRKLLIGTLGAIMIVTILWFISLFELNNQEMEIGFNQSVGKNAQTNLDSEYIEYGRVIVRHINEEGEDLIAQEELEGPIGTEYKTSRKNNIDYYMSDGKDPFNRVGDFAKEDTLVIYKYKKIEDVVDVESNNNKITLKVENEVDNREYKLRLEQESYEGDKLSGGKFTLLDGLDNTTLVKGTTVNGDLTLGMVNVNDTEDENYELSEDEAPVGYLRALDVNKNFGLKLSKSYNNSNKTFELSASSEDTELELEADTQKDEIIIKVKNDKIKTYELAIKQIASSVDGVSTDKTLQARVTEDGRIVYDELEKNVQVRDFQKIIYTIRIYNEGNQDMNCPVITQVLPKGLKFLDDSQVNNNNGWTYEDGKLITKKYVGEKIQGIDTSKDDTVKYIETQLEVEVEEDEAEENTLINTVSIPVDEKEENIENNKDTEQVNLVKSTPIYDLAIKKFASKVNDNDTGRNVEARLNYLNQIRYDENNDEVLIKDGQKIEYTIRVYNEGNKDLKGTKITDIIPEGFIFDESNEINQAYGWVKVGNNIETKYLELQDEIKGCKLYRGEKPNYKEIKLELLLDEDNVPEDENSLLNTVNLEIAENETDDLDNIDTDEVSLSRRPKTYDLAVKVFADKINSEETHRNVSATVVNNKIEYIENRPDKTVKDEQKIIYNIRVFNEGTGSVKGSKITDIIPKGLKFIEDSQINIDYGWIKNGNTIETNYLELQDEINGVNVRKGQIPSYKDVKVEFEVVEDSVPEDINKIINNVKIEKVENETNEENNEDKDEVDLIRREKIYDLAIKKFASKIDDENTGRDVQVSLTQNNEIKYTEVRPEKIVKEGQKIVYTIRIYNEGNQPSKASKIIESIPQGLKFIEDSQINIDNGWQKNASNIETTILSNKIIDGVRLDKGQVPNFEEVQVEFEVTKIDIKNDYCTIINTVEVEQIENEIDIQDNKAQDSVLAEKTPIYDLAIRKFVSNIDGQNVENDISAFVNGNDDISYKENLVESTVKDGQKVVYTLRVFNQGELAINGTRITETIPNGLRFMEDSQINNEYGWAKNDDKVITDYLVDKTINTFNKSQLNSKNYVDVKIEFEVVEEIANENNLIVNEAEINKHEKEENITNNIDTFTIKLERKIKTYNVVMKKFVYSLDNNKLDKEITASIDEQGRVIYLNDDTKTSVNKRQIVVFNLRIFNTGNQSMPGEKVIDKIPEGLKYIEDSEINQRYNWNETDGIVSTNYLIGQEIEGVELEYGNEPKYVDVQIECEVTGENVNANEEMINVAKVEPSENEENLDDNEDEAILILNPEEPKVYDLTMKKFLYSASGKQLNDREVIAKNNNGILVFEKNEEIYKVSNNEKLVYTLRIYNVGDGKTNGRTIIEDLPDGLEFDKDSQINKDNGWKLYKKDRIGNLIETDDNNEAVVVKTDILKNEIIAGCDLENNELPRYKDVQIELIVNENKIDTQDRIITNIASVESTIEEPNSENDTDSEKVYVKEFDLNVIKYIDSITIKDDKEEKNYTLGLEQKGKLFKKEIDKKKVNKTEVYVTYGLQVQNLGEIEGYVTELTDFVPENFELLDPSSMWKIDGKVIKTNELADVLIKPGETRTIQVSFKWKLNDNNLGERLNTAIISGYKNDNDAEDKKPDKDNDDRFIISLKTGTEHTIIITLIIILSVIAVVIIKKLHKDTKK